MTLTQITKVKGPGIHTLANIVSNTISLGGIATASNFKTGTSNLHNVGLEIAGINVLGADTPIGTGATIYDAGGAVFTGVVTATAFVGDGSGLIGVASTDNIVTGTAATFNNTVNINGDIDVDGHTNLDNVSVAGVSTFSGDATFSGNVSIGGTLTYEDVTNIDAIGIITARSAVSIADSIVHTGNTDTSIRFPADDTFTVETAGSEAFRVDSSQRLLVGNTASRDVFQESSLQVSGATIADASISILNVASGTGQAGLILGKRRGSNGALDDGDIIGDITFAGYDGTDLNSRAAIIRSIMTADATSNSLYADLSFFTKRTASGYPTETLRLDSAGKVGIGVTNPNNPLTIHGSGNHIYLKDTATNNVLQIRHASGVAEFNSFDLDGNARRDYVFNQYTTEVLRITSGGNVDINGTPPWTVTGGNWRNLSISGEGSGASGFLWLGNGAAATNADFDLGRINFCNGATITSQIAGSTQTAANDDGRITFWTKATGGNLTEKVRITSGGNVNIGANLTQTTYPFSVQKDLDNGGNLAYFANADSTYNQGLTLSFDSSKNIKWAGGSGAGGMIWDMGTNGFLMKIGGTQKLKVVNSQTTINGTTDGVLQIDTTDSRGSFIRFGQGGSYHHMIGCADGLVGGPDKEDLGLRAADNMVFCTNGANEALRITSDGVVNIGDTTNNTWIDSTLKVRKDQNAVTKIAVRNENQGSSASSAIVVNAYGNSWMFDCGSAAKNSNALTIRLDATASSNQGTEKLKIDTSGHITPGAAGTQDLGSTSKEFRHLYLGDSGRVYLGSAQEVSLYHNGSNSYVHGGSNAGLLQMKNEGGNIDLMSWYNVLIRVNAGENAIVCNLNNSVDLYYDSSTYSTPKLKTSHTGITVDGEVASSQDYPNYRPRVDWNFVKVKKLDPRITYVRSGPASYVDEFGIVKVVGDNVPRFDHDSETGESKGLLIEPSRSSILTQSTGNDAYSHYRQYDRGEIIKGPDGAENSAREYTVDSNGGTGGSTTIWANQALGMASGISVSYFVKITRGSTMAFQIMDNNNGRESEKITISGGYITDGSYATVSQSDPGNTEGTTSYERYPNGWVRVKWYGASGSANSTSYLQLYLYDHAAANSDGDNIGYAVWGFQVESGAFCTSTIYKPTTEAVSRGSDFAYLDGTAGTEFGDIHKKSEGTFVIDWFNNPQGNLNDGYVFAVDDGSGNNRIAAVNSNSYQVTVTSGGSSQGTRDLGSINSGDNKIAFTYKYNDQATSLNGSDASVDTTCTIPTTTLKYWWIGCRQGQYDLLGGYMKRIIYYPTRLSNNQLKTLSS